MGDERRCKRDIYGKGVHLTTDSCQAFKSCESNDEKGGCIILSRVLLGYPFMATGPLTGQDIPCIKDSEVLHDSIIAKPGIPNGKDAEQKQVHWEVVVPSRGDSQIFPELIIYFDRAV